MRQPRVAASIIKRNGGFSSLDVIEGSRRRPLWRAVCEFFSVSSAVMYFDQVSVKRQCIVTMEDSMVGRISLSRSWKNRGISILPPPLSSSYSPPIVSMCSLITWSRHVTRNLHVTIYIYINLIFRFIRFSFLFGFTLSLSLITYWKTDQTYCVIYETPDSIFSKGRVRSRLTCFILVLREPFSSRKIIKQLSPLVDVRYLAKKRSVEKRRNHTPLSLSLGTGEMIREDNSETSSNYRPPFPTTSSSLDKAPSSDPPLLPPLSTL